jgi:hypothetical protein
MTPLCLISPLAGIVVVRMLIKTWDVIIFLKSIKIMLSVLVMASFLLSPLLSLEIIDICDGFSRKQATTLISGIEEYKREQGVYPENLSVVYPDYVEKLPTATCLKPYKLFDRYYRDYKIEYCEDENLLLTVHSHDLNMILIYNFSYPYQWTQYESFDYCGCNCPEINRPK